MAAHSGEETSPQWKTTIIVSSSLRHHDTTRTLQAQQHRVRWSDSVDPGAVIFPRSGVAFLLVDPQDHPEHLDVSGLIDRTQRFVQVHRNSFLLLYAPFNGKRQMEVLSEIQRSNLRILPVRNSAEIVKGMLTVAKATCKPHVDSIRDRMSLARAHIIESSPVWEMLRDIL